MPPGQSLLYFNIHKPLFQLLACACAHLPSNEMMTMNRTLTVALRTINNPIWRVFYQIVLILFSYGVDDRVNFVTC